MTTHIQDLAPKVNAFIPIKEILADYEMACQSREASLMGRKEVFMGKAKFGIFGDGKEIAQLAMAKVFRKGDFRSGYYRDQTFMMAIGQLTVQQFFAQLYAHTDLACEPATAGRCMNGHFATRSVNHDGSWNNLMEQKNSAADVSCTAGKIASLIGLGYASKLYRGNPKLSKFNTFSNAGNEVTFGTIGNASCAQGVFFEAINAAVVLRIPVMISVWDDDYGISVPNEYQMTKSSVSKALSGFQKTTNKTNGCEIFTVKGWDYENLVKTYAKAEKICRESHTPVLIHVTEITQPQGHSTSGSHERYKSKDRLVWEQEYDCMRQMRQWMLKHQLADSKQLNEIEGRARKYVKQSKDNAWKDFTHAINIEYREAVKILNDSALQHPKIQKLTTLKISLQRTFRPVHSDIFKTMRKALRALRNEPKAKHSIIEWLKNARNRNEDRYSTWLYSQSPQSALKIQEVKPVFSDASPPVDGRQVIQACFDAILTRDPRVFAIGEDVGKIGDVNQGFAGLQKKHGELRVTDTGIREATIVGQGIGAALRGLRPIIEVQYLDYIYYALQTLADDLCCLQYRTKGGQKAPVIIRTRGHRLEGIWHSGSPMSTLLGALRGMYLLVPRNMTRAAGFYNTMLQSDDAAIIVECLNAYRIKERVPENIAEFTLPLGVPEIIREGKDITVVTYGAMCRIVVEAATDLKEVGISCEVIDVQTLLPFDRQHKILDSIKKTNRVVFADEDVPGGATAYMMQKVIDEQNAYQWLDSKPVCLSAREHRPAYGTDGDYFSKPNAEDVFETVYQMMNEVYPVKYPSLY